MPCGLRYLLCEKIREKISDSQSGFRAYTRDTLKIFKDIHEDVPLNFF